MGGTGCALLPLIADLGCHTISLIDGDTVEAANLERQPLYGPADIGRLKVEVALEHMRSMAPHLVIDIVPLFLGANNAEELLRNHDIIADCTDDLHARLLIDRVCTQLHVPLVSGAVHGSHAQVVTLHAQVGGPSLRSFFPGRSSAEQDGCDMRLVGVPVLQACALSMSEHIAALVRDDRSNAGNLEVIDTRTGGRMHVAPPALEFLDR